MINYYLMNIYSIFSAKPTALALTIIVLDDSAAVNRQICDAREREAVSVAKMKLKFNAHRRERGNWWWRGSASVCDWGVNTIYTPTISWLRSSPPAVALERRRRAVIKFSFTEILEHEHNSNICRVLSLGRTSWEFNCLTCDLRNFQLFNCIFSLRSSGRGRIFIQLN